MNNTTSRSGVEDQCNGKQAFDSYALAVKVARRGSRAKETRVAACVCPHCHKYHVGQSVLKRTQAGVGKGIKFLVKHS